jgi:hypothetical protein
MMEKIDRVDRNTHMIDRIEKIFFRQYPNTWDRRSKDDRSPWQDT